MAVLSFHPDSDPGQVTVLRFVDPDWSDDDHWYAFCNRRAATLNNRLLTYCEEGSAFEAAKAQHRSERPR